MFDNSAVATQITKWNLSSAASTLNGPLGQTVRKSIRALQIKQNGIERKLEHVTKNSQTDVTFLAWATIQVTKYALKGLVRPGLRGLSGPSAWIYHIGTVYSRILWTNGT